MDIVRVSSVQFAFKPINSFEDFASNVERLVDQAKDSDFVVFPETFTLELQYLIPNNDFTKVYEYTEQYIELFTELSREKGQYIVAGSHPTMKDGKLYNTGYIFCPDGRCFEHSKTHLFPLEPFMGISPGDRVEILETEKARVGLAICYEIEFPEVVRILTLKGAEIVFLPLLHHRRARILACKTLLPGTSRREPDLRCSLLHGWNPSLPRNGWVGEIIDSNSLRGAVPPERRSGGSRNKQGDSYNRGT
nr:nitrilase-related carbon-nitrogen hydrolase [Candidatus Sigynarchaeota archaeon]